jgi:hypothetical protein
VGAKIAVYTAIFGGYDGVLEIERPDPDISYFLFTDGSIDAAPHPWQLRPMPAIFSDPQRDARRVKALPHLFLPLQFDISVWIDGNCQIKNLSANAISQWIGDQDIALPGHAERNCIYKEAEALIASGLFDSPARISRQMSAYRIYGMPQDFGLHHTNFLIRRHNNPDCLQFCLEWWQHISAHSKRDQLSFDFVRWKLPQSKVGTLDISYNDNSTFRCSGIHRSPRRIVSDHMGSTVRCNDLPLPFLAASYNPQYDVWPPQFLDHLHHLNEIVSGIAEPLEGNLCYFHCQQDSKYSPPDPRRGERRETFLRALAGRSRLLEIGFNAGHSALLALTHSNASVTSIDNCCHAYTEPAAAHLRDAFPGRLRFFPLDSRRIPAMSRELGLGTHDMIHIDGGHGPDVFASDIATAITFSKPGTLVLVDDLYVPAIRQMTDRLVADCLIAEYGNLETMESGAYLTLETVRSPEVAAHSMLVNRLSSGVSLRRVSEETLTPFMSELLSGLDGEAAAAGPGMCEIVGEPDPMSLSTFHLDGELIDEIKRIGYHPFIIARNVASPDDVRFLICDTQNEIAEFSNGLLNARALASSVLLRGIERALYQDITAAADIFFSWIANAVQRRERIYLGLSPDVDLPLYYNYPIFEVTSEADGGSAVLRVVQLVAIFDAYYRAKGNDYSRSAILEALAVALERWWGIHNQLDHAAKIIARVLRINPTSINLRTAINALELRGRTALNANKLGRFDS